MKFSESWLKEYVATDFDAEAIGARLTLAGLELDGIEPAASEFSGVVVAKIESLEPHPDAEKLRIGRINDGTVNDLQVICGAANAYEGMLTALATVGAQLPGIKIKKAKLRGVESFGMLCSASELGMAESSSGILDLGKEAPIGQDVRAFLALDDKVLDVDLTPNRADCFSLRGIAREMKVLTGAEVTGFDATEVPASHSEAVSVSVADVEACPRYLGRVIKGVDLSRPTPLWMSERLRRAGVRSLNAVVDVTNYVMLELGQPMHAFDLSKVSGSVEVRTANKGENVVLLDGKTVEPSDDTLVIADGSGPIALAGVMGGETTSVTDTTSDLLLEAAYFNPLVMAGKARQYGMHTDSSHRFERGVDFELPRQAVDRATALIMELVGGEAGPIVEEVNRASLPKLSEISLRRPQIKRRLGIEMDDSDVYRILVDLGCVVSVVDSGWTVVPPSYRFDLRIEVDLIEELARVYGYDKIPSTSRSWSPELTSPSETELALGSLKSMLVDTGYQEVITYSFVDVTSEKLLNPGQKRTVLSNPISADLSVMRGTLWAGLLKVCSHNQRRQQSNIRIFETGLVFQQTDAGLVQPGRISGVLAGENLAEHWLDTQREIDFFDIKADVEALLSMAGIAEKVTWEVAEHAALHPGRCARLVLEGVELGWIGAIHPGLIEPLELEGSVFVFELSLDALERRPVPAFEALSRFPSVKRDLALVVDENVSYDQITKGIRELRLDMLKNIQVFDVYRGEGVANGRKSIALGLILQDFSRTLQDSDIEDVIGRILTKLSNDVGATLRV